MEDPDKLPALTLADDFALHCEGYVRKSGLQLYDERFTLLRDNWYGDTALNWLAPGSYYAVIEVFGQQGRYIESEAAYEESVYNAVFRLNVTAAGAAPYAPTEIHDLTEARVRLYVEDYVLSDAEGLAKLEGWLKNAVPIPSAGCPFSDVLTLTRADGSEFSCCPAEDSCGVVFANGAYYRFAADNEEFWALFGVGRVDAG